MAENLKAVCQAAWELLDAVRECEHVKGEDLTYARRNVTAAGDVLKKALYKAEEKEEEKEEEEKEEEEKEEEVIIPLMCEVCNSSSNVGHAHFHNNMLIGECCWDDRLYASE